LAAEFGIRAVAKTSPFAIFVFENKIDSLSLESNFASRDRGARTQRLGRNIDHLGAAIHGDVSQAS